MSCPSDTYRPPKNPETNPHNPPNNCKSPPKTLNPPINTQPHKTLKTPNTQNHQLSTKPTTSPQKTNPQNLKVSKKTPQPQKIHPNLPRAQIPTRIANLPKCPNPTIPPKGTPAYLPGCWLRLCGWRAAVSWGRGCLQPRVVEHILQGWSVTSAHGQAPPDEVLALWGESGNRRSVAGGSCPPCAPVRSAQAWVCSEPHPNLLLHDPFGGEQDGRTCATSCS